MALSTITPFCYKEYRRRTGEFASWVANHVQSNEIHGRTGWLRQLQSYDYAKSYCGRGQLLWSRGVAKRAEMHTSLRSNLDRDDTLIDEVNRIVVDWGHMKGYGLKFAPLIRKALDILRDETEDATWALETTADLDAGNRIAPISKVYHMFDPHRWIIYDSRVATALACLVRRFWNEKGQEVDAELLRFPCPPRRGERWSRPKGFPGCGGGLQGSLGFVYASWLSRQVAEYLKGNSRFGTPPIVETPFVRLSLQPDWQVYHIEMVLWMLGKSDF